MHDDSAAYHPALSPRTPPSPPPQRSSPLVTLLLLVAVGLLAWQVLGPRLRGLYDPDAGARAVTARGDLAPVEQSTIALFREASPSVVHVTNVGLRRSAFTMDVRALPQGTGSGFVWDEQGYVVTNAHVVRGGQEFRVTLQDDSTWKADLVGADASVDVAVLRLSGVPAGRLRPLSVGSASDLAVGQSVYAIGNPFGLDQTLTTGVVSGLGREINTDDGQVIKDVIQTDAAINPGNSGGPLLDSAGRLIGMNTAIISPSQASAGIGFAVPVETVNRVVPRLIRGAKPRRAGLGISLGPDTLLRERKLEGALISGVLPDSAAAKAGLRGTREDPRSGRVLLGDVVVALGSTPVRNAHELVDALDAYEVGTRVEVTVLRDGERLTLPIVLQAVAPR